ncbi:MAG: hypothetical protein EZS28_007469 [Streblomastix strix]|uniref:Uncharacterized protein n=1 Tax=Streblomastix strix TaxID=222440 RepID=A0A5J4WQZ5_9EUKA|nr:MAG: hypothetical protein EZS28_007469 [Streblomastix strix]
MQKDGDEDEEEEVDDEDDDIVNDDVQVIDDDENSNINNDNKQTSSSQSQSSQDAINATAAELGRRVLLHNSRLAAEYAAAAVNAAVIASREAQIREHVDQLKEHQELLIAILLERTTVASALTRTYVMHCWRELYIQKCIPVRLFGVVTSVAVDRIADKGSIPRRAAAHLLVTLIERNPFGANLSFPEIYRKLRQIIKAMKER